MNESGPRDVLRSHANPTIKRLLRLRDNRQRRRSGRFLVDGWRETARAIEAGLEIVAVYLAEQPISHSGETVADRQAQTLVLKHTAQQQVLLSAELLQRISYGERSRAVVAEFVEPELALSSLRLPEHPLILVLDGIEKPGNVGAVLRCADAAGIDAVILSGAECDLYNPNAIRNSLGAVFTVPCAVATREQTQAFLIERSIGAVAARVDAAVPLWNSEALGGRSGLAIVVGSESHGLGENWQNLGGNPVPGVQIPMAGRVDSLNVSVSVALIVYEAVRRRSVNQA